MKKIFATYFIGFACLSLLLIFSSLEANQTLPETLETVKRQEAFKVVILARGDVPREVHGLGVTTYYAYQKDSTFYPIKDFGITENYFIPWNGPDSLSTFINKEKYKLLGSSDYWDVLKIEK